MLKFAIIGVGSLGKLHLKNLANVENLVALCDIDESRFTATVATNLDADNTPTDVSKFRLYTDVDQLLDNEQLDFVVAALPTYLHAEIACKVLKRGIHVFSEKPMALTVEMCQDMLNTARENNKLLMIGQCLRYWPEYVLLKEYIQGGEYGEVISAEFSRYSPTPTWSWQNWLMDAEKSGGAALDMHVHDVDFINWVFGIPKRVFSIATNVKTKFDSIKTIYDYPNKQITSACNWGLAKSHPFLPSFLVRLEKATIVMESRSMKIYPEDGEAIIPEVSTESAYLREVLDFISCIKQGKELTIIPPESAMQSAKIALAEMKSAELGEWVSL